MSTFDLVLRGGTLIDGGGTPGRKADVVVNGIPAVRDGVESGARAGRLLRRPA